MPSYYPKISEVNQYQKLDKSPFIFYADLECIIEKIGACKSNPENSSTTKENEHISSGFSMSTIYLFRSIVKIRMINIEVKIAWRFFTNS